MKQRDDFLTLRNQELAEVRTLIYEAEKQGLTVEPVEPVISEPTVEPVEEIIELVTEQTEDIENLNNKVV
jgi:hypothetical protein